MAVAGLAAAAWAQGEGTKGSEAKGISAQAERAQDEGARAGSEANDGALSGRARARAVWVDPAKLVIDGDASEWRASDAPTVAIEQPEQWVSLEGRAPTALWRGVEDSGVRLWLGWNATDLVIGGELRDDVAQHDAERWYLGDGIELFLSMVDVAPQWGPDDWQLMLAPSWPERPWGVYPREGQPGRPDGGFGGVEVATSVMPGGVRFEARFPWRNFGRDVPQDGAELGFNVALCDRDQRGFLESYGTWTGEAEVSQRPERRGTLVLDPRPERAPAAATATDEGGGRPYLLIGLAVLYGLALWSRSVWREPRARRKGLELAAAALAIAGVIAVSLVLLRQRDARERLAAIERYGDSVEALIASGVLGAPEPQELLRDLAALLEGESIPARPPHDFLPLLPGGAQLGEERATQRRGIPFAPIELPGRPRLAGVTLSPAQLLALPMGTSRSIDGLVVVTRIADPRFARTSPRQLPMLALEARKGGRTVGAPLEMRDALELHFESDQHAERPGLEPALTVPGGPRGELHADALLLEFPVALEADEIVVRHVGPPTSYSVQVLAASVRVPREGVPEIAPLRVTSDGRWEWAGADPTIAAEVVVPGRSPRESKPQMVERPVRLSDEYLGTVHLHDAAALKPSGWEPAPLAIVASVAPFLVALFAEWLATRRRIRGKLAVGFAVTSAVPLLALTLLLQASLTAEHRERESERATDVIARAEEQLEREVRELEREAARLLRIADLRKRIDGAWPETSEELAVWWGEGEGATRLLERTAVDGRRVRVGSGPQWRQLPRDVVLESGPARPFGQLLLVGVAQSPAGAELPLTVIVARAPSLASSTATARTDVRLFGAGRDPAPRAEDLEPASANEQRRGLWDRRGQELVGVLVSVPRERGVPVLGRYSLTELLLAAGITAVFTVLLFAGILTGHLVGPIERLDRALRAGRAGEVEPEVADEVGHLATAVRSYSEQVAVRVSEMERLAFAQGEMSRRLDPEDARAAVLGFFAKHTRALGLWALWRGEAGEEPRVYGESGRELALPDDAMFLQSALVAGELLQLVDRGETEALSEFERTLFGASRRLLCLPLIAAGETRGAIVLGLETDAPREDLAFLQAAASQSAIVLENARLYRQAVRDAVTGFLSDPGFRQRVVEEIQRAQGDADSGVLLVQIRLSGLPRDDRLAGERLREAAQRLRLSVRGLAVFGRSGAGDLKLALPWRGSEPSASAVERRLLERLTAGPWPDGEPVSGLYFAHAAWPKDGPSARFVQAVLEERMAEAQSGRPASQLVQITSQVPVDFVATSPILVQLLDTLRRVAEQEITVLVSGETGVGKDRVAELVHRWSRRANGPLVHVHCPSLSASLIEDELFGHAKGAFTGAHSQRIGPFEYAAGGTVVLDEVAGLPPAGQVALLRMLETREVQPLGSSRTVPIDVRIVATTSKDLALEVERGNFRADLYFRLNVAHVTVPPLRLRRQALPDLVAAFLRRFNATADRPVTGVDPKVMDALYDYPWPGNLRELENVLAKGAVLAQGGELGPEHIDVAPTADASTPTGEGAASVVLSERTERLLESLAPGDRTSTAEFAERESISSRTALRDLQALVEAGYLVQEGTRRGARFRRSGRPLPTRTGH